MTELQATTGPCLQQPVQFPSTRTALLKHSSDHVASCWKPFNGSLLPPEPRISLNVLFCFPTPNLPMCALVKKPVRAPKQTTTPLFRLELCPRLKAQLRCHLLQGTGPARHHFFFSKALCISASPRAAATFCPVSWSDCPHGLGTNS